MSELERMPKTVFASVDEAMAELAPPELIELLKMAFIKVPGRPRNLKMEAESRKLLNAIEGGQIRRTLEKQFQATGKIEFCFSREAWDLLRQWESE